MPTGRNEVEIAIGRQRCAFSEFARKKVWNYLTKCHKGMGVFARISQEKADLDSQRKLDWQQFRREVRWVS